MSSHVLRITATGQTFLLKGLATRGVQNVCHGTPVYCSRVPLLQQPSQISKRWNSFRSRNNAELWDSMTSVSASGRKKGRQGGQGAQGVTRPKRPLLSLGIMKNKHLVGALKSADKRKDNSRAGRQVPQKAKPVTTPTSTRATGHKRNMGKLSPLERGWVGSRILGRTIGPPLGKDGVPFEGFDTRIIEFKMTATMTGTMGRKMTYSCFVVTGNRNGVAGYGLGKGETPYKAAIKARDKAGRTLWYFERLENHTVYHDLVATFHKSRVFIERRPKGYGLVCHRLLKDIAKLAGFRDLYAKSEGQIKNYRNLTKAFFKALDRQKTHQQIADHFGLNVVEIRPDRDNLCILKASPSPPDPENLSSYITGVKIKPISNLDVFDYDTQLYGMKRRYKRFGLPFFWKYRTHKSELLYLYKTRNQKTSAVQRKLQWEGRTFTDHGEKILKPM
ncbi:putative 28S ribosomal protein S5, mitochondrial [Lingula anatina]|uniref:Small ribosomal subunit protein uS5m n=1 Tax=Lingula anatina TaxID=7574 RepID=A0A1S3HSN7_LINAN|nr:putative 28S ribosomal protein S5, mitochondrial [Lingula anatina]|eukprot:XP_013388566.1 putative 28S ribosomal protein S5, mitochondrial [Lingula anatina]